MKLGLCNACKRHVRIDEAECPFCGGATEGLLLRRPVELPKRTSRAAYLMLSAGVLLGAAACDGDNAIPVYGSPVDPPPQDAGQMDGAPDDMGPIAGGGAMAGSGGPVAMPVYGVLVSPDDRAPAADAGTPDGPEMADEENVGAMPIYGLAPTPDDTAN